MSKNRTVKFLSAKPGPGGSGSRFRLALRRFRSEYPKFQFRVFPREYELHDRYMITKSHLLLLGRGLDVGNKESFVVSLESRMVEEICSSLDSKFDERWEESQRPR